jgi:hypothetical protein
MIIAWYCNFIFIENLRQHSIFLSGDWPDFHGREEVVFLQGVFPDFDMGWNYPCKDKCAPLNNPFSRA